MRPLLGVGNGRKQNAVIGGRADPLVALCHDAVDSAEEVRRDGMESGLLGLLLDPLV